MPSASSDRQASAGSAPTVIDETVAHQSPASFATIALETVKIRPRKVQHALGHASPVATERYLHDDRYAATVNPAVTDQLLSGAAEDGETA